MLSPIAGMQNSSIPMVVITQSDGASLLASLKTNGDNIYARIYLASDVDTQFPGKGWFVLPGSII